MSVLLLLFVYVFFSVLFNTIFILHASVSSISVVSRVRTPALILGPEQRLVIEPKASIHSLCYLLFAFFIHFTHLFLFFIFPCCFSLCLPLFFLFHLICFKRMVFSVILVLRTSWWFRAQADSLPRLFFGVFHLTLRTLLFRFVFLKFITNCQTFSLFFKKFFFNNNRRNTLSARKFIILVNHILINVQSAKGIFRKWSKTSTKYFAWSLYGVFPGLFGQFTSVTYSRRTGR